LKTFLTQTGSTLPLTSDPPVICFWKWIGWKDYEVPKNRNLESVSVKSELFFSPTRCIPTLCTHLGPLFPSPRGKKIPSPSLPPAASLQCYVQLRGVSLFDRLQNGRRANRVATFPIRTIDHAHDTLFQFGARARSRLHVSVLLGCLLPYRRTGRCIGSGHFLCYYK
jgi:hypothetical protein